MGRGLVLLGLASLAPASNAVYGVGTLDASGFDYVGMLSGASAAVIAPNWVLTAKHVGGVEFWLNGRLYVAEQRFDNPEADISLLRFKETFSGWYSPYYDDPTGKTLAYVGYGLSASFRTKSVCLSAYGLGGAPYMYTGYHMEGNTGGVKRMATNVAGGIRTLDYGWGPGWIQKCIVADLDYTSDMAPAGSRVDTLGDGGATPSEGGVLYGDSGSPALLRVDGQWRVVGVNVDIEDSNGPNPGGNDNYLDFGDTFYSTWVGGYREWMETTMNPVPEPATLASVGLGLAMIFRVRRKK